MTTIENAPLFQSLRSACIKVEAFFRNKPGDFKRGVLLVLLLHSVLYGILWIQSKFRVIDIPYYFGSDFISFCMSLSFAQVLYIIPALVLTLFLRRGYTALGIVMMAVLTIILIPICFAFWVTWSSYFNR